jgi:hypothetical protein
MCLVSFVGLYFLYSFFLYFERGKDWLIFCAVFLAPSVLFWGSGVLKEGILLFSIGGLLFSFMKLFFQKIISITNLTLFFTSFLLLLINKVYWLPILILPLVCLLIIQFYKPKNSFLIYFFTYFIVIVGFYVFSVTIQKKNPIQQIAERQQSFINLAQGGIYLMNQQYLIRMNIADSLCLEKLAYDSVIVKPETSYLKWKLNNFDDTILVKSSAKNIEKFKIISLQQKAGSILFDKPITTTCYSFIKFIPVAFVNASIMPLPWRSKSMMELIASLENFLLIGLVLFFVFYFKNRNVGNTSIRWFLIFIVLSVYFVVGFTTPVAGAVVRYKMPAIPFLLMLAVTYYTRNKSCPKILI